MIYLEVEDYVVGTEYDFETCNGSTVEIWVHKEADLFQGPQLVLVFATYFLEGVSKEDIRKELKDSGIKGLTFDRVIEVIYNQVN